MSARPTITKRPINGRFLFPFPVGYAKSNLPQGYTIAGGQFIDVNHSASSSINLNSIVAKGDDLDGAVSLSTIDGRGYTKDTYTWAEWSEAEIGWINDEQEFVTDVTFPPSTAFWVQADTADVSLQTAGTVEKSDVTVSFNASGYALISNPFPVAYPLSDLMALGDGLDGAISISTIDDQGYTQNTYTWAEWSETEIGWINDAQEFVIEVTIAPGQGFWLQTDVADVDLYFPAIEL